MRPDTFEGWRSGDRDHTDTGGMGQGLDGAMFEGLSWDKIGPILGAVASVCAILGFLNFLWLRPAIEGAKQRLDTPSGRRQIKVELAQKPSFAGYQNSIRRLNTRLYQWFGKSIWSTFLRCVTIALFYPILSFLLAWIVSGTATLGNYVLLEDMGNWPFRALFAATLVLVATSWGYYVNRIDAVVDWLNGQLTRLWGINDSSTDRTKGMVRSVAGAFAFAFVFAGAFAFAFAFTDESGLATTLLIFYVALPLLNAAADTLSWGATRYFLRNAAAIKTVGWRRIFDLVTDLLLDLIAAYVCLILLVAMMVFALEWAAVLFTWLGADAPQWQTFRADAIDDPWGAGLFVWLMLATTLVPTLIHLVVGISGLLRATNATSHALADKIVLGRKGQAFCDVGKEGQDPKLQQEIARHMAMREWPIIPTFILTCLALCVFAFAMLQGFSWFGWGLGTVADRSAWLAQYFIGFL